MTTPGRPLAALLLLCMVIALLCSCSATEQIVIEQYVRTLPTVTPQPTATPEETAPAETPAPTPRPMPTATPLPPEVTNDPDQPPLLGAIANSARIDLSATTYDQLVLVSAEQDNTCRVYCYNKLADGLWKLESSMDDISGHISQNGLSWQRMAGDETTPQGLYPIGEAFGADATCDTGLKYRQLSAGDVWVTDTTSIYYNTFSNESLADMDWISREALSSQPEKYVSAFVIEFNAQEPHPLLGTSVFMCCGNAATTGSIAVDRDALEDILAWLNSSKSPHILIMPAPETQE